MSISSWFNWLQGKRSESRRKPRRCFVPVLDHLENRIVPALSAQSLPPLVAVSSSTTATASGLLSAGIEAKGPTLLNVTPMSETSLLLKFSTKLRKNTVHRTAFVIPGLKVAKAQLLGNERNILLTTSPLKDRMYTVQLNNLLAQNGALVSAQRANATVNGTPFVSVANPIPPRVVGAVSTSNTTILVSFSKPVTASALDVRNYSIRQTTFNPEIGFVRITGAAFVDKGQRTVLLTTLSQNDLAYSLHVVNVRDLAGNALAPPIGFFSGSIDFTSAFFNGIAPPAGMSIDTDGDGLPDNVEQRGWIVTIKLLDGIRISRGVSSDPLSPDTDNDGLDDRLEKTLSFDPRSIDTDFDGLTDYQEYNEIFSDGTSQDTDGDGLDDAAEFNFFRTSVVHADTDGDQLPDSEEILLANRNPRVADLPTPAIEIGDLNLQLDVRFTETTTSGSNVVENRTVNSQLTQSARKEYSNTNSNTQEAFFKLAAGYQFENTVKFGTDSVGGGVKNSFSVNAETGWTGSWTSSYTNSSVAETQEQYAESLSTNAEISQGTSVQRDVVGARMSVTVFLKNASTLAYNIKNMQVTAFLQDPQNPGRLTPLATLLPEQAPAEGFNLGPLVPERGPFIFSSDTIFTSQVERLMCNPTGVVFKIANFDITDELGRNFAFTSKDIFDRTGSLVIDFGGFDSDGDGQGDLTEIYRIATDGGRVIDTNGDSIIDAQDRRVILDASGKQVGITLRDALEAIGLKHYNESENPTSSLSREEIRSSYSTFIDNDGLEQIARIRDVGAEVGVRKAWVVLTPTGIDPTKGLDNTILTTASDIKIAYVQDLDGDLVPANVEALFGTSDLFKDTDGDGLDDRFETLIGWDVDLGPLGRRHVFSRGNLADSDGDGLSDAEEAPGNLVRDSNGLIIQATRSGPTDHVTDPLNRDTDSDGVSDFEEINGYNVILRNSLVPDFTVGKQPSTTSILFDVLFFPNFEQFDTGTRVRVSASGGGLMAGTDYFVRKTGSGNSFYTSLANAQKDTNRVDLTDAITATVTAAFTFAPPTTITVKTNPAIADSDGDNVSDGVERRLGGNPTDPSDRDLFVDDDGDGLTNIEEIFGWEVTYYLVSTTPLTQGTAVTIRVTSDPRKADTDGDGIPDGEEWLRRLNPRSVDTDGDGLTDFQEVRGFVCRDLGIIFTNPLDTDTDNDMRSDGDEAELVDIESKRWIVRPVGKTPYRVYSDPLQADADFDGLVDGEEFNWNGGLYRTDPNKSNTDRDSRSDGEEWLLNLNPLVEDFLVTVIYRSFLVQVDGDGGTDTGDFSFEFNVRLPSNSSTTGLANPTIVVSSGLVGSAMPVATSNTQSLVYNVQRQAMQLGDNTLLNLADWVSFDTRSIAFSLTKKQRFSVEGVIDELDAGTNKITVKFGGLEGLRAIRDGGEKIRTVFNGSSLELGSIIDLTFAFDGPDNTGNLDGFGIKGEVRAMILVS